VSDIDEGTVLVRAMDVTARLTYSVEDLSPTSKDGIMLETLIGRYVLDRDASEPWLLVDGSRSVAEVAAEVAQSRGVEVVEVLSEVRSLCAELERLGLLEVAGVLAAS
jgi:hypothetical protein